MSKMSAIQKECDFLFISSFETTRRTKKKKKQSESSNGCVQIQLQQETSVNVYVCTSYVCLFFSCVFFFFTFVSLTLVHYYFKCL